MGICNFWVILFGIRWVIIMQIRFLLFSLTKPKIYNKYAYISKKNHNIKNVKTILKNIHTTLLNPVQQSWSYCHGTVLSPLGLQVQLKSKNPPLALVSPKNTKNIAMLIYNSLWLVFFVILIFYFIFYFLLNNKFMFISDFKL